MAETTRTNPQRDIETAQRGLRKMIDILEAIKGGADRDEIYHQMGMAIGTGKMALAESGAK